MNTPQVLKCASVAVILMALGACGSRLQLSPAGNADAPVLPTASSSDTNTPLPTIDGNQVAGGGNTFVSADDNSGSQAPLICGFHMTQGTSYIACTCSTDSNHSCPVYNGAVDTAAAADANASSGESRSCTSRAVSGGYIYSCYCGVQGGCSTFFNPADPNATQPGGTPTVSCQTTDSSPTTVQTTCTCVDSPATTPCRFYHGTSATDPYSMTCESALTKTGVTTTCDCDAAQQATGNTCPATLDPSTGAVSSLDG